MFYSCPPRKFLLYFYNNKFFIITQVSNNFEKLKNNGVEKVSITTSLICKKWIITLFWKGVLTRGGVRFLLKRGPPALIILLLYYIIIKKGLLRRPFRKRKELLVVYRFLFQAAHGIKTCF